MCDSHQERQVSVGIVTMVLSGVVIGAAVGQRLKSLLYQVNAADVALLAVPLLTIFAITLLSAIPAILRAIHIDPVEVLRAE